MCTRFVLLQQHLRDVLTRLGVPAPATYVSRYNLAPSTSLPALRSTPPLPTSALRPPSSIPHPPTAELAFLRWGFVPAWSRDDLGTTLCNARAETAATKPSFRDSLRHRRCLLPATGFYEWEKRGRERQPWLFRRADSAPFAFAALWDAWIAPDGTTLETCAIVTTTPNALMAPLHHRMPLLLDASAYAAWLDPRLTDPADLAPLLRPVSDGLLTAHPVSRHVNDVHHDDPACLAPATAAELALAPPQLDLGL